MIFQIGEIRRLDATSLSLSSRARSDSFVLIFFFGFILVGMICLFLLSPLLFSFGMFTVFLLDYFLMFYSEPALEDTKIVLLHAYGVWLV